jgi:hypothetical protein
MTTTVTTNLIRGIVGPTGSGKTYVMARLFGQEDRALVYQVVRSNEECDIFATHLTDDVESACRILRKEEKYRVVYKVQDNDVVERGRDLDYPSSRVLAEECYVEGNMTLFLDEAHELCDQQKIHPRLRKVIRLARNNRLSVTWISQSMEVHREIRRNSQELILFHMHEPGDLEKIEERCGTCTAERVSMLRPLLDRDRKPFRDKEGRILGPEYLTWSAYGQRAMYEEED